MDPNRYQRLAMQKEADQELLREWRYQQGVEATRIQNGLTGLTDEVGELAGAVKGWLEYQRILDVRNVEEEVGDCLWRLGQICKAIGITLDQAMESNLKKLDVRYAEGIFTFDEAAEENRDRAAEAEALRNEEICKDIARQIREENTEFVDPEAHPELPSIHDPVMAKKIEEANAVMRQRAEDDGPFYE